MSGRQSAVEFIRGIRAKSAKPVDKIAFIISNSFQCEHFQGIMRHLGGLAEALVVSPCNISELPHEFVSNFSVKSLEKVKDGFTHPYYRVSVSSNTSELLELVYDHNGNRFVSNISLNAWIGQIATRLVYSIGAEHYETSTGNNDFDQIFVNGPYSAELYARKTGKKVVQVGAYRLDGFFNNTWNRESLLRKFFCDPSKKVIAWLPSLGDTAFSLDFHVENIAKLVDSYNVILRPHPNTFHFNPKSIQNALHAGIINIDRDALGNLPLFALADYMLFDYGGSMFNAIYTGKKFLLLDCPDAQSDSLFAGQKSPEFDVRGVLPGFNSSDCLKTVLSSKSYWEFHSKVINKIKPKYYLPNSEGRSAKIVADRLRSLL